MAATFSIDGSHVGRSRTARKAHRCECGHRILVGDVYLEHIAFPGHDALGSWATRPSRMRECAACATRYGREHYLEDVPFEQCAREGLL